MRLAIHNDPESFSRRWMETCRVRNIPFSLVDCLASDAIHQCAGMDAVLWHWDGSPEAQMVARAVIASLEAAGTVVFPGMASCWHFEDKVAQKYLLEAIGAPLVPSYVFLTRESALTFLETTDYPKVFKLRCGAGSSNVRLLRSKHEGRAVVQQAFGPGFPASAGYFADYKTKARNTRDLKHLLQKARRAPQHIMRTLSWKKRLPRQRDYVYLQDFQAGNSHDTRVTVIGDRAFAFRRGVRPGDFRASGSGNIDYSVDSVDLRCVQIAFQVSARLGTQSLAFDFVHSQEGDPLIVEVSYCFLPAAVHACPGHWDRAMNWHPGQIWPEDAILDDVLEAVARRSSLGDVAAAALAGSLS